MPNLHNPLLVFTDLNGSLRKAPESVQNGGENAPAAKNVGAAGAGS